MGERCEVWRRNSEKCERVGVRCEGETVRDVGKGWCEGNMMGRVQYVKPGVCKSR